MLKALRIQMGAELRHAWAAGIVDGEGCISIKTSHRGKYYFPSVVVGQSGATVPPMLRRLKQLYGGSFCKAGQWTELDRKHGRRPKRNWQVVCMDAIRFLKCIRPYLVQKARQADIALLFTNYKNKPGQRRNPKHLVAQRKLFIRLHKLKNYRKDGLHAQELVRDR